MKQETITLNYDAERLAALKIYLEPKQTTTEKELMCSLDALYLRHVPASVRDFLELRAGREVSEPKPRRARSEARKETLVEQPVLEPDA